MKYVSIVINQSRQTLQSGTTKQKQTNSSIHSQNTGTYAHNWSLQNCSLDYDLTFYVTYVVCVYFRYEPTNSLKSKKYLFIFRFDKDISSEIWTVALLLICQHITYSIKATWIYHNFKEILLFIGRESNTEVAIS